MPYRHYHYEYKLTRLLWKVELKDLVVINTNSEAALQNIRNTINVTACGLLHTHTNRKHNKLPEFDAHFLFLTVVDSGRQANQRLLQWHHEQGRAVGELSLE